MYRAVIRLTGAAALAAAIGPAAMAQSDQDAPTGQTGGAAAAQAASPNGGEQTAEDTSSTPQVASDDPNIAVAYEEDGRYYTETDIPTFHVAEDGTVGWPTYSGFRRYHSECHVCHGPDGEGGSYAPALKNSAIEMDYYDFYAVVVNGKKEVNAAENSVMPAFGDNPNVMCYLDDIYVYLKARGAGAIPRGRPAEKEAKSEAFDEAEASCLGL